jgi:hypothetical protein
VRISAHTRRRFADFCAGWGTVRSIAQLFEAEGIFPGEDYDPPESGVRRYEVDAHEDTLDLSTDRDNHRLLRVYVEAIEEFGRANEGELAPDARTLAESLKRDGAPLDEQGNLIVLPSPTPTVTVDLADYSLLPSPEVLRKHFERINANAERDPAAAIGSCKELVESTCKFILDDYEQPYSNKDHLLSLYKKTANVLKLSTESVPESAKGSQSAQRALRSMVATVQALAELRNELGLGHGRTSASPALGRHAKLTVQLTRGVMEFLLDTWHVRRAGEVA